MSPRPPLSTSAPGSRPTHHAPHTYHKAAACTDICAHAHVAPDMLSPHTHTAWAHTNVVARRMCTHVGVLSLGSATWRLTWPPCVWVLAWRKERSGRRERRAAAWLGGHSVGLQATQHARSRSAHSPTSHASRVSYFPPPVHSHPHGQRAHAHPGTHPHPYKRLPIRSHFHSISLSVCLFLSLCVYCLSRWRGVGYGWVWQNGHGSRRGRRKPSSCRRCWPRYMTATAGPSGGSTLPSLASCSPCPLHPSVVSRWPRLAGWAGVYLHINVALCLCMCVCVRVCLGGADPVQVVCPCDECVRL
jgi:hypothetical protein